MADIEELHRVEVDAVNFIDDYIEVEFERLGRLKKLAEEYEQQLQRRAIGPSTAASNPVDAFLAVKRVYQKWNQMTSLMHENRAGEFFNEVTKNFSLPVEEDLQGAAVALLRLQDTYNLSTAEMARGDLQHVKAANELSAHDCFELGRIALNFQNDSYHTIPWMTEALERLRRENGSFAKENAILDYLGYALFKQGNVKQAIDITERLYERDLNHPHAAKNIDYYYWLLDQTESKQDKSARLSDVKNPRPPDKRMRDRGVFEQLCRGEIRMAPDKLSKLYCAYKRDTPFLRLAPLKYEVMNIRPTLLVFKNVISDNEIALFKALSKPKLKRSTVRKSLIVSYRIGKRSVSVSAEVTVRIADNVYTLFIDSAWLTDADDEVVRRVTNYGLGGHYDPHFDAVSDSEKDPFPGFEGNRIATVLFYLSQPEAGGATVFMKPKVTVFPSKYDALFWNNLHPNGSRDEATRHAGCPVLAGSKWIANKWIRERAQLWRRPCALNAQQDD